MDVLFTKELNRYETSMRHQTMYDYQKGYDAAEQEFHQGITELRMSFLFMTIACIAIVVQFVHPRSFR